MMPNTADIAAQAGVRAILEDWARRIDDDGTPSQIVSAEEIRAALAAIEPQAVAEPVAWAQMINGTVVQVTDDREKMQSWINAGYPDIRPLGFASSVTASGTQGDHSENFRKHVSGTGKEFSDAREQSVAATATASDERAVEAEDAAKAAWNSIADEHNNWSALSLDERADFTRFAAALAAAPKAHPVQGWQTMDSAPKDGRHCILSVPEPSGFIYSVQGSYQDGQWNAVHRDNVQPLAWMLNLLLPEHLRPVGPSSKDGDAA